MASTLLRSVPLPGLTAARLWLKIDRDVRRDAARALYTLEEDPQSARASADGAIASAMRFRPASVRKLPVEKRVQYLASSVRPDESLAVLLLQALHFKLRRPILNAFLDALGIPHEDGHIKDDAEMGDLTAERLDQAAGALYAAHPEAEVDLYLLSLLAFEHEVWGGLEPTLARRATS